MAPRLDRLVSGIAISLVVSTFQRLPTLRRSLPTLLAQDLDPGSFEILVVVDGSTDGTLEHLAGVAADIPRDAAARPLVTLRVIRQENRGLAAARNRGAREARGRIVLWLDDDAHASPQLARAHLRRHEEPSGGERVVTGPFPLWAESRRSFLSAGVGRWADELAGRLAGPGYRLRFTDCCFANASLPRSLWERTGGFDEGFRRFGNEDYDFGLRLTGAGVEFAFEPDALAAQDYGKDFAAWLRDWRDIGRADIALWRRHPAIEADLAFARIEAAHPLRRVALSAGLNGSRSVEAALAPVRAALAAADRAGLTSGLWDRLKWLPADFVYGLGVRDALTKAAADPAGAGAESVPPSLRGRFSLPDHPDSARDGIQSKEGDGARGT